jgi:hypothetical protein
MRTEFIAQHRRETGSPRREAFTCSRCGFPWALTFSRTAFWPLLVLLVLQRPLLPRLPFFPQACMVTRRETHARTGEQRGTFWAHGHPCFSLRSALSLPSHERSKVTTESEMARATLELRGENWRIALGTWRCVLCISADASGLPRAGCLWSPQQLHGSGRI